MINTLFLNQINKYSHKNINQIKNAMKEVLQEIILCGLGKTNFFKSAVFYGGTSLRIFRKLPRFSEDLDFTLTDNSNIDFDDYILYAKKELESMNIECDIYKKEKKVNTTVLSRYFRFNLKKLFDVTYNEYSNQIISNEILSIKVELECNYFNGGLTEIKLLTYPSFSQIRTFNYETLFASKVIAILNRKWKSRIKGRDFYDYLFYISNKIKINLIYLENGLKLFGYLEKDEKLTIDRLKKELIARFESINFNEALKDVLPFIGNSDPFIDSFNKDTFLLTVDLIEVM